MMCKATFETNVRFIVQQYDIYLQNHLSTTRLKQLTDLTEGRTRTWIDAETLVSF